MHFSSVLCVCVCVCVCLCVCEPFEETPPSSIFLFNIYDNFRKLRCISTFKFPSHVWLGCGIRLHLVHFEDVINYIYMYNHSTQLKSSYYSVSCVLKQSGTATLLFSYWISPIVENDLSFSLSTDWPFQRSSYVALFQLSLFVHFLFILDFFTLLRMTACRPSAGKDTKCMQFKCKLKNLRHPEAGLMQFCYGKKAVLLSTAFSCILFVWHYSFWRNRTWSWRSL